MLGEGRKMNKTRMKKLSMTLLVIFMIGAATVTTAFAHTTSLSINLDPNSGCVPKKVRVCGNGASPCGDVEIWWDQDGDPNVLDILLGVTEANGYGHYELCVTIPEAFCGAHDVTAWDKASAHSAGAKFTVTPKIKLCPECGPVGTSVRVKGTGFKPSVQIDLYYDGKAIATDPAAIMTNSVGSFWATFVVPESVFGHHMVGATDRYETPCWDDEEFFVKSKIVLDPNQGPCGTKVTITGTGFDACEWVDLSFECCLGRTWCFNDVTKTNTKGSFTYVFEIPCTLEDTEREDGCCQVCPGPWWIDASTPPSLPCVETEEKFIVTPWFTIDPCKGPVGTEVTASGYGFDAESVDIVFKAFPADIVVKSDVPVDEMGNFVTTFEVPEVVEGCYAVSADGIVATKCCSEELDFEVLPWIWITPCEGYVGDTITVVGKGWDSLRHVDVIYAGIDKCTWPLPYECIVGPHMALWLSWEETPCYGCNAMIILQPWGWELIAESMTDENGSFETTFEVPESPGGYHPIYAGQCISTGHPNKLSANVPVFKVDPKIWVVGHEGESAGLSGEYVTLYGTGFSYVEFWMKMQCYPEREFGLYFRVGALELDFDSNKQWIDEFNFIMNKEYSEGWQEMYWAWLKWITDGCSEPCPLFPEGYLPVYIDLNGTLSHGYWWRWLWLSYYHEAYPMSENFYDDLTYEGCPFLKVPMLEPGEKELLAYYFGLEVNLNACADDVEMTPLAFEPEGVAEGIPKMFDDSIKDPMSLLYGTHKAEFPVTAGKIYTETASTTFTVNKPQVEAATSEEIMNRINELDAKLTGLVTDIKGTLAEVQLSVQGISLDQVLGSLAEIKTSLGTIQGTVTNIDGNTALIKTDIGTFKADLTNLDSNVIQLQTDVGKLSASITAINEGIATIQTSIGTIQTDIASINGKLVALDGDVATIQTSVGTFSTSLTDINTKITVMNDNIATIQTDVGTIKGLVTKIDGNNAVIMTDLGEMKGTVSLIKGDTGLQPATIGLSILAAISAIAAAVMILRKVYLK
jgi:prefoldin subunit 5